MLVATGVAEIILFALAIASGLPLPLLPAQHRYANPGDKLHKLAGVLGIDIPSFSGQAPGNLVLEALAFFFLRQGLKVK